LGDELVLELRVRDDLPLGDFATTGHGIYLLARSSLGALDAVLRALAVAVGLVGGARPRGARRVEGAAHDVVAHAREVLDAAAADEDHGVLLQVVPLAGDVARHLHAVGEPDAADLAERRVGLLRRGGVDAN